jgi:hypothetical protein
MSSLSLSSSSPFIGQPTILPYFGGEAGEICRVGVVSEWELQNTTTKITLQSVMETDLYQQAKLMCEPEIESYNRASGIVCLLEQDENYFEGNLTYNTFWSDEGGGFYFDGLYDLATMFAQTSNFTELGAGANCLADCYTGLGPGCNELYSEGWLTNYGKIPVDQYCDEQWFGIDNGYNAIKLCAAKAIGGDDDDDDDDDNTNYNDDDANANSTLSSSSSGGDDELDEKFQPTKKDMVSFFEQTQFTEGQCAYKYCNIPLANAIEELVCDPAVNISDIVTAINTSSITDNNVTPYLEDKSDSSSNKSKIGGITIGSSIVGTVGLLITTLF